MPLRVAVIVEGHGDDQAIPSLLNRVWYEALHGDALDVLPPFRKPQGILLKEDGLKAEVDKAQIKLNQRPQDGYRKLVLILIDAEQACPKVLAPQLVGWARQARSDADIACVLPHPMFETWFIAAAASLAGFNGLPNDLQTPDDPEGNKLGKRWIKKYLNRKYNERTDQRCFAGKMDLSTCRANAPSFDKLCRELELRLPPPPQPPVPETTP